MKKKITVNKCLSRLICSRVIYSDKSRVDLTEALLKSQESQKSLNCKAVVFEACGNSPVTTTDEKENRSKHAETFR